MKYLLKLNSDPSRAMIFEYGPDRFLVSLTVTDAMPIAVWKELWNAPPLNEDVLLRGYTFGSIKEIPTDLSFAAFWEAYAHKVGNKPKTEKLWNALSEMDKIAALAAVPRYIRWLSVRTVEQAMASTWLTQRRWENDFSSKK